MHCRRRSVSSRRKRGVLVSTPDDSDRVVERELIQCCHCQFTKAFELGDEKTWGLCWRCNDFHCPRKTCREKCVPVRQWLQNKAEGKAEDYTPVRARVGAEPPRSAGGVILGP